ncbi:hypothetical protein MKX01_001866 [Papaver californicum]|nr:hypothetical protein MKX01_001866 [Papaver californicum]
MTEPKLFTTSSLLMAFLFSYSASVQLNDPEIKNIAKLDLLLGIFLFVKVIIEDYVYELVGINSMDLRMALLVILSYSIPLVFFVFLKRKN